MEVDSYQCAGCGFTKGKAYSAPVIRITEDKVYFKLIDNEGVEYSAVYYAKGHMNLAEVFTKNEKTRIVIKAIRKKNWIEVVPEFLPIDLFYYSHTKGSLVEGIIRKIKGSIMRVQLGDNIFCETKRCNHAEIGKQIICQIRNYSAAQQRLKIFVFPI